MNCQSTGLQSLRALSSHTTKIHPSEYYDRLPATIKILILHGFSSHLKQYLKTEVSGTGGINCQQHSNSYACETSVKHWFFWSCIAQLCPILLF